MAYITREDGERFVIPSYRDVLSAKKLSLLKREILLLSANYGEYIALQRKNAEQYEVAFSNDYGYLLGETVWSFFKKPPDLVYCEEVPNTMEAILVVVKSGSVFLDGIFPMDAIADELVIFQTQQNNFEIYIHGDVPISEHPEDGKFCFDASSVKSFTILDSPVFDSLPKVRAFQLQLVETVLRSQGIGIFPIKPIIGALVVVGLLWLVWAYFSTHKKELPRVIVGVVNPYQVYIDTLVSPDPAKELEQVFNSLINLSYIPGWYVDSLQYSNGVLRAAVKSGGVRTDVLFEWAEQYHAKIEILPEGFYVVMQISSTRRPPPTTINPLNQVIGTIVDRMSYVLPGNNLQISQIIDRRAYSDTTLSIKFDGIPLTRLEMIRQQLNDLPLVLLSMNAKQENGNFSGTINLQALGN